MKKTVIALSLALIAMNAGAQTMYDALKLSQNDYYGTARSIGMGNAMTAVGGDLGSIGINPAGSAVYNYSQFTLTPNLTMSTSSASYAANTAYGESDVFTNSQTKNLTRFSMPNVGATFNMQTGNRRGLKAITYGFIINGTNNYTDQLLAGGQNSKSSYQGAMAVAAAGYDSDFLNGYGYIDDNNNWVDFSSRQTDYPYNNPDRGWYPSWNTVTNAQAGAIANYGYSQDPSYYERYIAATEGFSNTGEKDSDGNYIYNVMLAGPLNQAYGRKVTGSKYDAIFNVGFNFNDNFYVGANLGITNITYDYDEYFKEAAVDPSDFIIEYDDAKTYFSDYRSRYSYSADATGIYAKIGVLAVPAQGLRIGAAIQTPTLLGVNEIWRHAVNVNYTDSQYNGSATSPEGNYSYTLRTPYRLNAGIAYTFWGMALVSADYEMTDYSSMRYRSSDGYDDDAFEDVNADIRDCMGISHMVRLGVEFKPVAQYAIRAGYNFSTTPEYSYDDQGYMTKINDKINSFSIGLGYSSNGSFFADLAARAAILSNEIIYPYEDYLSTYYSPAILNKRERYSLTATIGWRF